ncbi:unnamed protein product [Lymnaea stagnalis]|uniref:Uncharacterized protein n=1 Tax=Lymnaea stagnalis TaxID=6523 RepID=A0AAV2ICW8_LYMST
MEVHRLLPSHTQDASKAEGQASPQQSIAFQEVLELTQRKLLRHITMYSVSMDLESYPRLILIDLKTNLERPKTTVLSSREAHQRSKVSDDGADASDSKSGSCGGDIKEQAGADDLDKSLPDHPGYEDKSDKYCIRLLCEHEQGWHEAPTCLSFPSKDGAELEDYLKSIAPYVARILAVLKYSKINIPILTTPQGENLRRKLEEWCTRMTPDFQNEYNIILQTVMEEDENRIYGGLKRCHMPNGKILWLCEEHEKSSFTLTEEKYKPQLGQREGLKEIYEMEEEEQMLDDSRPTTSLDVARPDSRAHDRSPQKGTHDDRPSAEVQQIPVKVVSPTSGQVLPRRPNLTRRQTSSRKTTSQACRLM